MTHALYDIVIQPLVYLIELVFSIGYRLTDSPGVAIVGVSLAVNLLCLPLYRMADAAQDAERARQAQMKPWIDHINSTFSGDERVMMTQAYYRLQHYRPAQALVGSLSLLLQIPFFMAAYTYLSNLTLLRGVSFLFLPNLGAADALLRLGSFELNVMPMLMTALNCVSTLIYTRGLPLRDKLQAYGLAAVFLVLLWDSPSGLVFYWTCNQLFSLGKNIFMKVVPNPRKWAMLLAQACVVGLVGWLAVSGKLRTPVRVAASLVALGAFELLWFRTFHGSKAQEPSEERRAIPGTSRRTTLQFVAGGALLTILLGALIPSALIADSPTEFMTGTTNPLSYILHTTCVWGGVFLLWWGTYFALSGQESRERHVLALWLIIGVCLLDYFRFGQGLGTITTTLKYDGGVKYETSELLVNLAALAALVVAMIVIWRRWRQLALPATGVLALSLAMMSLLNVQGIATAMTEKQEANEESANRLILADGTPRQILHLSQTERNVAVIFLDRAISGYLPYIMAERPELEAQFDGFTYYPNTLSHGYFTNYGTPGLYGGYEYVPAAMNIRDDESLHDKHNEAMLLMPTLMSEAGFRTTVIDPPYAGSYQLDPDLSIYNSLENTEAIQVNGAYTELAQERLGIGSYSDLNRKFVYYAAFKVAPELLQRRIYDKGRYLVAEVKNSYPRRSLMNELSVLELLPELTDMDSDTGGFVLLGNCTTHDEDFLQLPDYDMAQVVNNEGLEDFSRFDLGDGHALNDMTDELRLMHYHVNAAALMRLGRWFDWMRDNDVWDNTRVIIVADHGRGIKLYDDWVLDDDLWVDWVNPLLMVKDFDATGFTISEDFMTNADTPTLAMAGIIESPINPFTGNVVSSADKTAHAQLVTSSWNWKTAVNNGAVFDTADTPWYSVHDNIFDLSNWRRYETFDEAIEAVPQ